MKAVIMAGGKGTRLQPYTALFPKPLMPLGDMPVLELLLHQLESILYHMINSRRWCLRCNSRYGRWGGQRGSYRCSFLCRRGHYRRVARGNKYRGMFGNILRHQLNRSEFFKDQAHRKTQPVLILYFSYQAGHDQ